MIPRDFGEPLDVSSSATLRKKNIIFLIPNT